MDLPRSPRLLLLGTLMVLSGFMAVLALSHLAAAPSPPGAVVCSGECAPRPWLDPEKARRFASVFQQ
ncbi:hypothetical protein [Roseomonas haemaphysalidis]|uniref:Uncharacterized protein n=1 Tax=Roseomonas haemaphysalidis TaxID=2768162 RepID=A0ABS3KSN9_9PROT|nr:hypothetical protein [Roseomonas haemaphysalidis]MBO1080485.1 hypothetical protein [Roseomonas haemaphysalidis]